MGNVRIHKDIKKSKKRNGDGKGGEPEIKFNDEVVKKGEKIKKEINSAIANITSAIGENR